MKAKPSDSLFLFSQSQMHQCFYLHSVQFAPVCFQERMLSPGMERLWWLCSCSFSFLWSCLFSSRGSYLIISRSLQLSSHRLSIRPSVSCKSCSLAGYGNNYDQLPVHPLESLALVSLLRFNATFPSSLTTWPKCSSS